MAVFSFPYLQDGRGNDFATVSVRFKQRPFGGREISVQAVVDSGAMISVFRAEIADDLGIPVERGQKHPLSGLGGYAVGYLHVLDVDVGGKVFSLPICFARNTNLSFNLLGQIGFFDEHQVTFNKPARQVTLEEFEPDSV